MPDLAALEKLYGEECLTDILTMFVATAESSLECIQAGLVERDARTAHHFAYSLKGPAALLAADNMAKLCEGVGECHKGKWFDADAQFADLRSAFRSLRKSLQPGLVTGAKEEKERRRSKTQGLSLDLLEQRVGKQTALAMAKTFKEDTKDILSKMAVSVRKYDYEELHKHAHKLAGCCASIFIAKELRGLSVQLQALCNEEHTNWIEVATLFDKVSKSYLETEGLIATYLEPIEVA